MNTNLEEYYDQRASHYDDIYRKPERQSDLNHLAEQLQELLVDKTVLEVACGTGYWTEHYVDYAAHVVATDISNVMLDLAKSRSGLMNKSDQIEFKQANAFDLPQGDVDACVAGFWWSHVKRSEQDKFLDGLRAKCGSGTLLVMFDNCYVEGDSTPIARTDAEGNTYQIRRLPDGSRHEVIKNYPSDSAIRKKLGSHARDIRIGRNTTFWTVTCVLR
jgi:SAM-dependent methyltransferase